MRGSTFFVIVVVSVGSGNSFEQIEVSFWQCFLLFIPADQVMRSGLRVSIFTRCILQVPYAQMCFFNAYFSIGDKGRFSGME